MDSSTRNCEGTESSSSMPISPQICRARRLRRLLHNSRPSSLRSYVLGAAAALGAAAVIASMLSMDHRPAPARPALVTRPDASFAITDTAITDTSTFKLLPTVSAGRLIPVFQLPPRALCRDAHWQGADFSGQWFAGADCSGAQLEGARLIGTNFRGANLTGAEMKDAMMWYANLDSARLIKANLKHADLSRASLRQASLEGADLRRAIFKAANLTEANLLGANVREANFTAANLQGAVLTGLVMDRVNFIGANLAGADLSRADLRNALGLTAAQLKLANTDAGTRMPEGLPAAVDRPSQ
jgi:uncharacterized protein YjbI with pentapeptide repeats